MCWHITLCCCCCTSLFVSILSSLTVVSSHKGMSSEGFQLVHCVLKAVGGMLLAVSAFDVPLFAVLTHLMSWCLGSHLVAYDVAL